MKLTSSRKPVLDPLIILITSSLLSKQTSRKRSNHGALISNKKRKNITLLEAAASGRIFSVDGDVKEQRISRREKSENSRPN
jgi:hypothetical protein